jgi:mannose-6-phosphate isomerase-like protein (cupin superfamily)
MMTHNAEFLFLVVLSGSISIEIKEQPLSLEEGDACSIPINTTFRFIESSSDLELLEIALPGNYEKRAVLQQPN